MYTHSQNTEKNQMLHDIQENLDKSLLIVNPSNYQYSCQCTARGYLARYNNPLRGINDIFDSKEASRVLWDIKNSLINKI